MDLGGQLLGQDRRQFLAATGSAFAGLLLSSCTDRPTTNGTILRSRDAASPDAGDAILGALEKDPAGLLDLPRGFSYRIVSRSGQTMSDGFLVPDAADGMGCFDIGSGEIALVRNHELRFHQAGGGVAGPAYDTFGKSLVPLPGGTTTLVLDSESLSLKRQYRTLAGTIRNCAGGTTPWGSWLSCEESVSRADGTINKDHGFVFEVPANASGLIDAVPLKAMGRFNHEAACVDPATGAVYLTEDRPDSLLYRFLPNQPRKLKEGGTLQALSLDGVSDTRNWGSSRQMAVGERVSGEWITLNDVGSLQDDLRRRGAASGAAVIARGEGIHMGEGELYFTATSGGLAKEGQVFRLRPSHTANTPDTLELFFESGSAEQYSSGDNLCVAPYGHLVVCEDQYTDVVSNFLRGITPNGESYPLAKLHRQTELAGACYSPDGRILFVNAYAPTITFAIQGPWPT
ncbi:MAG: alkaline phosphatase PhoX [Pseudomonadota bacterium]